MSGTATLPDPLLTLDAVLRGKLDAILADLAGRGSALVAFSGGVDSAVVAALAHRALGEQAWAVTAAAETLAGAELDQARRVAAEIGIRHRITTYSELDDPEFVRNPSHRCYVCQGLRMDTMVRLAAAWGCAVVCDGTNASDPGPDRPGLRAVRERGVHSPLLAHGVDKTGTRALARALGLSIWDRPANACLSSRIPHGQAVTLGKLRRIEAAEELLAGRGFRVVRVRHDESGARVEVGADEVSRLAGLWDEIAPVLLSLGFARAAFDARGYRQGGADPGAGSGANRGAGHAAWGMRLPPAGEPAMNPDQLRDLLEAVAAGRRSPEQALADLAELPYAELGAELGFAKLDLHRELRNGLPEAVYAAGKQVDDLAAITARLLAAHGRVLVTRLAAEPAAALLGVHAQAVYHERARILTCGPPHRIPDLEPGSVAVLAAGTSDLPVAEEAAVCAAWYGLEVERLYDVGVAGLHRLLGHLAEVRRARVVIAVAGMDGALPTVVASLVSVPVVAVPTSVGYGASFGGVAALLTMLNACAPGIGVVNIDNGFGAAVLARRIVGFGGGRDAQTAAGERSASIASP